MGDSDGRLNYELGEMNGNVVIQFPHSLTWAAFTPEQARILAADLLGQADQIDGGKING